MARASDRLKPPDDAQRKRRCSRAQGRSLRAFGRSQRVWSIRGVLNMPRVKVDGLRMSQYGVRAAQQYGQGSKGQAPGSPAGFGTVVMLTTRGECRETPTRQRSTPAVRAHYQAQVTRVSSLPNRGRQWRRQCRPAAFSTAPALSFGSRTVTCLVDSRRVNKAASASAAALGASTV